MKEWVRKTFGKVMPTYGVCGGAQKDCVIEHLDPMDRLFQKHDYALHEAKTQEDRDKADADLYYGLKGLDRSKMKKVKWYNQPYAYTFRFFAMQVFKPKKDKD